MAADFFLFRTNSGGTEDGGQQRGVGDGVALTGVLDAVRDLDLSIAVLIPRALTRHGCVTSPRVA